MSKLKVGVLRGGPSSEYDVSLNTGSSVLKHLDTDRYIPIDILIGKDGQWHVRGIPTGPQRVLERLDVVFNAMHGEYGEDGQVQHLLDRFSVPYTGSRAVASALAMNKVFTKQALKNKGIKMAHSRVYERGSSPALVGEIFTTFPQPSVVKPVAKGSSVGVSIARSAPELEHSLQNAFDVSPRIIVEAYIPGREATCAVLQDFRGEELYALPPIEIVPPARRDFFDYDAKYSGETEELCPGNFDVATKQEIERIAREVHKELGLRHYSRSDFIVSPRGIYFLEVNTLPGLTSESLLPKAVQAVGGTFPQLLDHLIDLAISKR